MFVDENSVWPRPEPTPRPEASGSPERAARLFLIFALVVAFLPFSLASLVDLVRFVASRF